MTKIRKRVFRNMKMKTLLSLGVGFVSLICLTVSGLVIGGRVSDITRESGSGLDKGFVKRLIRNKCHIMIIVF